MLKLLKLIFISALIMTPQFLIAEDKQESLTHQEAITKIMNLSGLDVQVPQISEDIISGQNEFVEKYPQEMRAKIIEILSLSFDKNIMLQSVKDEISKSVSLEESKAVLEWYQSDIGKEITKAEEMAINTIDVELLSQKKDELFKDKERVDLCKEIEKKAYVIDTLVNTQIDIMKSSLKISQPQTDDNSLEKYFATLRKEVKSSIEEATILSLIKSYESIDSDKLKKYIDFLSKPTTNTLIISGNRGISKAILDGTNKMIEEIMKLK